LEQGQNINSIQGQNINSTQGQNPNSTQDGQDGKQAQNPQQGVGNKAVTKGPVRSTLLKDEGHPDNKEYYQDGADAMSNDPVEEIPDKYLLEYIKDIALMSKGDTPAANSIYKYIKFQIVYIIYKLHLSV
jgi:hypothetical protein